MHELLLLAGLCSGAPGLTEAVALNVRQLESAEVRSVNLPLKPGERVVRQVAVSAPAARANDTVVATLRIKGAGQGVQFPALIRQGAVPLPDGGTQDSTSFIGNIQRDGDDLVAETIRPAASAREDIYSVVELADSQEWKLQPVLIPDPQDTAPRGERGMLVLVHGLDHDNQNTTEHESGKITVWDGLRTTNLRERVAQSYKIYMYEYPTYRTTRENGDRLAQMIQQAEPNLPDRQLAICAHSMGAQVSRYAAAAPALRAKIGLIATFAGVNHGTILASMLLANWHIMERVGPAWWVVLKGAGLFEPDTPGLRCLQYDDFDGAVTAEERQRFAIPINDELAAFNRIDPNTSRTVTLQGDISSLTGKGPFFGLGEELIRRGAEAYNPVFANIDPLVPLESGLLQGPAHTALTYPNVDHFELPAHAAAWADVIPMLESLHRGAGPHAAD